MGQQQFLLLGLGVVVIGIAIFVGIALFGANSIESNKDGVTNSLLGVAADAYQFKQRPTTLGGGRPSFVGYNIPMKLRSDDNGTYTISSSPTDGRIVFQATSAMDAGWVATCTVDSMGKTTFAYTGW